MEETTNNTIEPAPKKKMSLGKKFLIGLGVWMAVSAAIGVAASISHDGAQSERKSSIEMTPDELKERWNSALSGFVQNLRSRESGNSQEGRQLIAFLNGNKISYIEIVNDVNRDGGKKVYVAKNQSQVAVMAFVVNSNARYIDGFNLQTAGNRDAAMTISAAMLKVVGFDNARADKETEALIDKWKAAHDATYRAESRFDGFKMTFDLGSTQIMFDEK